MTDTGNSTDRVRSFLVLIGTAATIAFNGLASTGYLNGVATDEVSNRYPTVITPAGFTFTIWGAIYLGLIGFSIYQLLPSNLARFRPSRTLYLVTCLLNCLWLWSWHQFLIAGCLAVIVGLWATLLMLNIRFRVADSFVDGLFGKGVFGLYFGWVTAATLVNAVILMVSEGVTMTPQAWNLLGAGTLLFASALAVVVRFKLRNFLYSLALAWAATGIGVKQSGNTLIVVASAVCVIVGLVMAVSFVMDREGTITASRNE